MMSDLETCLRKDGLLEEGPVSIEPLSGGVSCEIQKVEQNGRVFIVKRALERLRVPSTWIADVSRNAVEAQFYAEMAQPLQGHVPRVLFHNTQYSYFVMEYLGEGWENWKVRLLRQEIDPQLGASAGEMMAKMHLSSWGDARLMEIFDQKRNFRQLRTDPYLRTAAENLPQVAEALLEEANRLDAARICVIHGDFSPKNILVKEREMMLLDAEVATLGDPAFDVAFFITHLVLKAIHREQSSTSYLAVAGAAWRSYRAVLKERATCAFEGRSVHLVACLLLARVAGKSPAEYLNESQRERARQFGLELLNVIEPNFLTLRTMLQIR